LSLYTANVFENEHETSSATTGARFSKLPKINLGKKNYDKPITSLLL